MSGLFLSFIGAAFIMVPSLPEIIDAYKDSFDASEGNEDVNHKGASLYSMIQAFGNVLGSLVGGFLYDAFGYRQTCDFNLIFSACVVLAYLLFNMKRKPRIIFDDEMKLSDYNSL